MAEVKIVAIYPRPVDIDAFEKVYAEEHVPMVREKMKGMTNFVATKVVASPQGTAPFHRIAELYFPSLEALQECAASPGGQETIAHAVKISTGGAPIVLIAEEESLKL
ncbi:MAG TPA: EthD family reductase [Pyrinomonadaceae bacterium]|nr:EthD family reductase [Pyrinomonadaceae bacterium]